MVYEDWMIESLFKIINEIGILPFVELSSHVIKGMAGHTNDTALQIADELEDLGKFGP